MSKAARAVEIYQEEAKLGGESLRKRCIARFKSELAMKDAGAGTYFQNTKKKVEGAGATPQLQLSPNPKPKATEQPKPIPGMVEKAGWIRYTTDANGAVDLVEYYATRDEQLEALGEFGGMITADQQIMNIGDIPK